MVFVDVITRDDDPTLWQREKRIGIARAHSAAAGHAENNATGWGCFSTKLEGAGRNNGRYTGKNGYVRALNAN